MESTMSQIPGSKNYIPGSLYADEMNSIQSHFLKDIVKENINSYNESTKEVEMAIKVTELKEIEDNSKLVLKSPTPISKEDFQQRIKNYIYIDLNSFDSNKKIKDNYYTIGILTHKTDVKISHKSNLAYMNGVFSLLHKMNQNSNLWEKKSSLKYNGYPSRSIMFFKNSVPKIRYEKCGSVFAFLNPDIKDENQNYDLSLSINDEKQLLKLGESFDFAYCNHYEITNNRHCECVVNKSIEKFCETHQSSSIAHIKSNRPSLRSDYVDRTKAKKNGDLYKKAKNSINFKVFDKEDELPEEEKKKREEKLVQERKTLDSFLSKRLNYNKNSNELKKMLHLNEKPDPKKEIKEETKTETVPTIELEYNNSFKDDLDFVRKLLDRKKVKTKEISDKERKENESLQKLKKD